MERLFFIVKPLATVYNEQCPKEKYGDLQLDIPLTKGNIQTISGFLRKNIDNKKWF